MKKLPTPPHDNMLHDIYTTLMAFPIVFRARVDSECGWSIPTFYRKAKQTKALSNAEKEKIIAVLDEIFQLLWNYFEKYRKK